MPFSLSEIKLAVALVALIGAFSAGAVVTHKVDNARYEKLELSYKDAEVKALEAARAEQKRFDDIATQDAQREAETQARMTASVKAQLAEVSRHVKVVNHCVPYGLVRVLDAASSGRLASSLPLPAGKSDNACAPIDWDTLARSVADNYGTARANAEQLNSLIDFYKETKPK